MGRVYQRGGVWWIQYSHQGKRRRESSGSAKRPVAVALLKQRQQEASAGRPHDETLKVTLSDLRALITSDYELQERRSSTRLGQLWKHLAAHFGAAEKVASINAKRLGDYVSARIEAGAARNTVKNELNALRRAFRLAQRAGMLLANEVPLFPTVKPSAPRQGFLEREDHERVRAALPPDAGDLMEFLFWTGWRTSEAKGLRWSNVDEKAGVLRIETSKSGEPRTLPYGALPALVTLIEHRRALTDRVQKKRDKVVPHVFHRNGEPLRELRRSWKSACVTAGLGHEVREPDVLDGDGQVVKRGRLLRKVVYRVPHDYRRSTARNLSRAGVPEAVIMKLCGWKTRSVFDRYRIVAEKDLAEGLARLAVTAPAAAKPSKVSRIRRRRSVGSR
jgi:integrase